MFDIAVQEFAEGEKVFLPSPISSKQHIEVLNLKFKIPITLYKDVLLVFDMSSFLLKKKKKLIVKTANQIIPLLTELGFHVSYILFDSTYIKKLDTVEDLLMYEKNDSHISSMLPNYNSSNISNLHENVIKDNKYELVVFFSDESQFLSMSKPQLNQLTKLFREQNFAFFSFSSLKDMSVAIIMRSFPKLFDLFITNYQDIQDSSKYVVQCLKNKKIQIFVGTEVVAYYNVFKIEDEIDISAYFLPPDRKIVVKVYSDVENIGILKIVCGDFIHEQPIYAKRSLEVKETFPSFEAFLMWSNDIFLNIMENLCEDITPEELASYVVNIVEADESRLVMHNGKELSLKDACAIYYQDKKK